MSGVHSDVLLELENFAFALLAGAVMTALYDVLRIFRRIIRHGIIWVSIEDGLYCLVFAVVEFILLYWRNDGIFRAYILCGTVLGIVLYHFLISRPLMGIITKIIHKIKKCLQKFWKSVIMVRVHHGKD